MSDFPAMEYKPLREEEEQIELAPGETSLDFMRKIYRSVNQPMARRMKAAEYAMQFEHPKLSAQAVGNLSGKDFSSMLERAILRSTMTPDQLRETRETPLNRRRQGADRNPSGRG